jgi:hypothetical protein
MKPDAILMVYSVDHQHFKSALNKQHGMYMNVQKHNDATVRASYVTAQMLAKILNVLVRVNL